MSPSLDLLHAAPLALPDHVRLGRDSSVLGTIDDPAVTLAIWERASPLPRPDLAEFPALRFAADAGSVAAKVRAALADAVPQDWHDWLARDVETLARLYATLTGEDRVEVRIERVTGNGCWKFHADYVALRMITTYCGQATQWLPHGADPQSAPRALAPGDVGLFKGRERAGDRAIIHRSPPIAGSAEDRLLLVIDTEWPDHG
ncbi:hypothetical protein QE385_001927 [Sphingomonas sp. SORGH_AS 950]|uniref:DUF1826 domain-containing protein n=1 Tax=Sphingomonas sp. SORGH_AS_0950 TaxID=3041792 RepID=UPI002781DEEC|nr:DUF1826 domain-containing protein [Sphingomonas sp. SORGH_AS_0950]MDQ1157600.1 hypothetical protein [Sphingomonas sp. SORGH_AS_0950]